MSFLSWGVLVVAVFEFGLGVYTLSTGARTAPANLPPETALRVSRLKGWGYVFVGFTFLFAFLGMWRTMIVVSVLCVAAAVVAVVLLWKSVALRQAAAKSGVS